MKPKLTRACYRPGAAGRQMLGVFPGLQREAYFAAFHTEHRLCTGAVSMQTKRTLALPQAPGHPL